jgi:hypothetical protein
VTALFVVNGRLIFSVELGGTSTSVQDVSFDVAGIDLSSGSYMDFIVTPGQSRDTNFDSTLFEVLVTLD